MKDVRKELSFLNLAENLKTELRHSWLSDGRQESVAEHCWRLALMAFRYANRLDQKVDVEKCLKMALVHDFAEAKVGDLPIFETQTPESKLAKYQSELQAMIEIKAFLNDNQGDELYAVWQEYEEQKTYESKFIKALDKIEAFLQHYEAPLSSWEDRERRMLFQNKWMRDYCAFDNFLTDFAEELIKSAIARLVENHEDVEQIKYQAQAEELSWAANASP